MGENNIVFNIDYSAAIGLIFCINIFLVSLIIITQLISYPLFLRVGRDEFLAYHKFYTKQISYVVTLPMMIELLLSIYVLTIDVNWLTLINITLLSVVWLSTFIIQVPIHNSLSVEYSGELVSQLIKTNWLRTSIWTLKLILIYVMCCI